MFERSNQNWRKRKRIREIDFDVIEKVKKMFDYTDSQLAELLKVSKTQIVNYRKCGKAPANRVIAMMQAIELMIEDEARTKRERIKKIMLDCS